MWFNETQVGFDASVDITVLPCGWFDPAWLDKDIRQFFYKNKNNLSLDQFFKRAFVYHWHNRWNFPVNKNSIIDDLYQGVLSEME